MTAEELAALPPRTPIYIPDGWFVTDWLAGGLLADTNYFALLHPPERQPDKYTRRANVVHVLDLIHATTNELSAWLYNAEQLQERIDWIKAHKLTDHEQAEEA